MTEEKKQQAIQLIRQGLETVPEREYTQIAELPTGDQNRLEVRYSFKHGELRGYSP